MRKEFLRIDRGQSLADAQELLENASIHIYQNEIAGILPLDEGGMQILLEFFRGNKSLEAVRLFLKGCQISHDEMQRFMKEKVLVLDGGERMIPTLNIADNMFVAERYPFIRRRREDLKNLGILLDRFDILLNTSAPVSKLSWIQSVQIELIRAYLEGKECVLLDLRRQTLRFEDYAEILSILYKLCEKDMTFILMDHQAARIAQFADSVTVFRNARTVRMVDHTPFDAGIFDNPRRRILRETIPMQIPSDKPVILQMENQRRNHLKNVRLTLRRGELATIVYQSAAEKEEFIDMVLENASDLHKTDSGFRRRRAVRTRADAICGGICVIDGTDYRGQIFSNLNLYENICMMRGRRVGAVWRNRSYQSHLQKTIDAQYGRSGIWKQKMSALTPEEQRRAIFLRCLLYRPSVILLVDPYAAANEEMLGIIAEYIRRFQEIDTGVLVLTEQSWVEDEHAVLYLDHIAKHGS